MVEPVVLGNWRDVNDDVEVIFHHAPGEQLDSAEVGYVVHPVDDLVFQSIVFEEHRFVGDAGGEMIDAVMDDYPVFSCHIMVPFVCARMERTECPQTRTSWVYALYDTKKAPCESLQLPCNYLAISQGFRKEIARFAR